MPLKADHHRRAREMPWLADDGPQIYAGLVAWDPDQYC